MTTRLVIHSPDDWRELVKDAQPNRIERLRALLPGSPSLERPGKVFKQAIDQLLKHSVALQADRSLEAAYQESLCEVYNQFKERAAQFKIDPSVPKGVLLRNLALEYFGRHPKTVDLLINQYCKEEIAAFSISLTTPSPSVLDQEMGLMDVKFILAAIDAKVASLACLYMTADPQSSEQIKRDLHLVLVTKFKKAIQDKIKCLKEPGESFRRKWDCAFLKDLKQQELALIQQKTAIETTYSSLNQQNLERSLKRFQESSACIEAQLKALIPTSRNSGKELLLEAIARAKTLPEPANKFDLDQGIWRYQRALNDLESKLAEVEKFSEDKKNQLELVEKNLQENIYLQTVPKARETPLYEKRSFLCKEYQTLLDSLEPPAPRAIPLPVAAVVPQRLTAGKMNEFAYRSAVNVAAFTILACACHCLRVILGNVI